MDVLKKIKIIFSLIFFIPFLVSFYTFADSKVISIHYINAPLRSLEQDSTGPFFSLIGKKLPAFTKVEVEQEDLENPVKYSFTNEDQNDKRPPTNGFVKIKKIVSAPGWSEEEIREWNSRENYLASHFVNSDLKIQNKPEEKDLHSLLIKFQKLKERLNQKQQPEGYCEAETPQAPAAAPLVPKKPVVVTPSRPRPVQERKVQRSGKSTWGNYHEWYIAAREAIQKYGDGMLDIVPKDAEHYGWSLYPDKVDFYANLLGAICQFESDYNPQAVYREKFRGGKGESVMSRGLLQLSVESSNLYGAEIIDPKELHDPETNIQTGAMILSKWIKEDQRIYGKALTGSRHRGAGRYWAPFRSEKKRSGIQKKMLIATPLAP